jgi:hypothetical protein
LLLASCTTRGVKEQVEGGDVPAEVETVRAVRAPAVPAPRTTWTRGPRLEKEGTDGWRLQGVQHWEESGEEYRDLFLEQETSITHRLRGVDARGASRLVDARTLHVLEWFPCLHKGSSAMRECNDLHDYRLDLGGSCAGEIVVEARLRLGRLHYARRDGSVGERVTEGAHASDYRFHLGAASFRMRWHRVEAGFVFVEASPPTRTTYAFRWDECGRVSKRGDAAERLPIGGVDQRPEDPHATRR